jgi:hypothetical protein
MYVNILAECRIEGSIIADLVLVQVGRMIVFLLAHDFDFAAFDLVRPAAH